MLGQFVRKASSSVLQISTGENGKFQPFPWDARSFSLGFQQLIPCLLANSFIVGTGKFRLEYRARTASSSALGKDSLHYAIRLLRGHWFVERPKVVS